MQIAPRTTRVKRPPCRSEALVVKRIKSAVATLTGSPDFVVVDARLRSDCEALLTKLENSPLPRLQAICWLDLYAERYLKLVSDQASWESYVTILLEVWFPTAYMVLFGSVHLIPTAAPGLALRSRLERRIRHWQQRASAMLALHTPLARNLRKLCQESGWNHTTLARETHLEKKVILAHMLHGRKAQPKTLQIYAETFSTWLKRTIHVADLLAPARFG
jgi:hypothetical protein